MAKIKVRSLPNGHKLTPRVAKMALILLMRARPLMCHGSYRDFHCTLSSSGLTGHKVLE